MRLALVVAALLSVSVRAQEPSAPPLPTPSDVDAQPQPYPVQPAPQPMPYPVQPVPQPMPYPVQPIPVETPVERVPTWAERCFGYPSGLFVMPLPRMTAGVVAGAPVTPVTRSAPVNQGGSGGSSASSSGSLGGGDGKALLVIVVLAAIALPIVVYAVDDDAPPIVSQRFGCPSLQLDLAGGVDVSSAFTGPRGGGQARLSVGYHFFGMDLQLDVSPGVSALATHALVRLPPKKHIEGGIAVGYRRMWVGGELRQGFDVGLPHRYAFWRDDLRTLGLEVRPMFTISPGGVDPSLEVTFIVPVFEMLHARVGGRVYSFGQSIVFGGQAGLSFGL